MGSTPGNMKKLTGRQEAFAQDYVLNGGNATQAYRSSYSYSGMAESTLYNEASRTLALPQVSLRIEELRQPAIDEVVLTIQERRELLTGAANELERNKSKVTPKESLRAIDLLNHMDGLYVTKTESKNAVIVKLVIEEENPEDVIEGEISTPGDPGLTPYTEE